MSGTAERAGPDKGEAGWAEQGEDQAGLDHAEQLGLRSMERESA